MRVTHRRHHTKSLNPKLSRVLSTLNIDLVQRLDMLSHERNRHDKYFLDAFVTEALQRPPKRRLQPFGRPYATLIAKQMLPRPVWILFCAQLARQPNRFFHLFGIWIPFFHQTHRQSMRAEHELNSRTIWKLA